MLAFPTICRIGGDINLPPQKALPRFWINLIFLNLIVAFAFLFWPKKTQGSILKKIDWCFMGLVGIFLCALPPIFSGDLHEYIMRGRILGVYHENPYLAPRVYSGDLFYELSTWVRIVKLPENYGPGWSLLQWIAPAIAGNSYFCNIFLFKMMLFGFYAASVWLLGRVCYQANLRHGEYLTAFFALNPILVSNILIDGHNDIVMVFWCLLAIYLHLRDFFYPAIAAATMAVLIKFTAIILLPPLLIHYIKKHEIRSTFGVFKATLISLVLFFGISVLLYAPFWVGPKTLIYFSNAGGWFTSSSVPYAVRFMLGKAGLSLSESVITKIFFGFFMVNCILALCWMTTKKADVKVLFRTVSWMFVAMNLSYTITFYGHHLIWALPFLVLSEFPIALGWALFYSIPGLFFYFKRISALYLMALSAYGGLLAWTRLQKK